MANGPEYGVCKDHGDRAAMARCGRCGRYMCPACVAKGAEVSGTLVCGRCLYNLAADNDLHRPVPWETRGQMSALAAFFATWREIIFTPRQFFAALNPRDGVFKPLIFAAICVGIGFLGSVWGFSGVARSLAGQGGAAMAIVFVIGAAPLTYVAVFAATIAFLHLLARGFGGTATWRGTARAVSYSQAGALAEIIPAIGGVLALVLRLSLYGWGVSAVHGFSTKRALAFYAAILLVVVGSLYFLGRLVTPFMPLIGTS